MAKIIFVLGGARSGKSSYALSIAKKYKKVAFVATGQALDKEMQERIRKHKQARPKSWQTFEEPKNLSPLFKKLGDEFNCIVVDCLTLLVSNLILSKYGEREVFEKIKSMLAVLREKKALVILVSNEVGLGLVPVNKLGRDFRDIAGKANQMVAKEADEVFFTVAGIPQRIK
jgi:adenosylcobinamide kinase / adenosylcobinamide-phosphate guanylyltransferase